MKQKLVIVNDCHPDELPGAATIAYNYFLNLQNSMSVEFYCPSESNEKLTTNDFVRLMRFPKNLESLKRNFFLRHLARAFLKFTVLLKFTTLVLRSKPDFVWFHQIGHRVSYLSISICHLLGIKTICMFHDYSGIIKGKLYPHHLGVDVNELDEWVMSLNSYYGHDHIDFLKNRIPKSAPINQIRVKVRRTFIRSFVCKSQVFFISQTQANLYGLFKFESSGQLPNPTEDCACNLKYSQNQGSVKEILFAGRLIGKGLETVLQSLVGTNILINLAGDTSLFELAKSYLPEAQIRFHGKVSRIEIFRLIHHVDLVCVPSICFDVYPSILVEALSHGTKILTHRTVGNYDLAGTNKIILAAYGKPLQFDLEQFGHFLSENCFTYSQASSRFLQYIGPDEQ